MLIGSWAKALLIAQASFTLDLLVRLVMFLIGKMISSMVIDLALKSMTIPNPLSYTQ
jgi:hypothetical protein